MITPFCRRPRVIRFAAPGPLAIVMSSTGMLIRWPGAGGGDPSGFTASRQAGERGTLSRLPRIALQDRQLPMRVEFAPGREVRRSDRFEIGRSFR